MMMKACRRLFLTRRVLPLAGLALAGGAFGAAPSPHSTQTELVYLGSQGKQIHALRFDPASGKLAMIGPVAEGPRSTWIVAHPRLPILYAVDDDSAREGRVIAYGVDRASGALAVINETPSGGKGTTYLWLDAPSMTLLAANFGSGSASSIETAPDGRLGALVSTMAGSGSGPHRRQAGPHAHSAAVDPSGSYVLVPDLGADRVFVYGFERAGHTLAPDDGARPRSFATPPGSGPRHLAFGADGRFVYLLNELTAEIMTLRWDAREGRLAQVQTVAASSADFKGSRSGAEIAVSRDGRFVYVANRGENTLLAYRVNQDTGELSLVQSVASGGETPWGFALHPSGKWLLVANQRSGSVAVFGVDPATGMLAATAESVAAPAPVGITFLE
jgi:6-phosphogluconolactonase